jgi:hypothetical protein
MDGEPAKQQLLALTKKYKLFYPDEIMFDGETIEWVCYLPITTVTLQLHTFIHLFMFK